jgi:vancomycin resistance protein YoaR
MPRPSPFRLLVSRLIIAGAIILISFPLGVIAYLHTLKVWDQIAVDSFGPRITQSATHDTTVLVNDQKFIIKKGEILNWTESYTRQYSGQKDLRFTDALYTYIITLAQKTDLPPVDAKFTLNNSIATIIAPGQNGHVLNISSAGSQLREGLLANESQITLTQQTVEPAITADKINSLGINHRIAVGESNFSGSTLARIQNIKVSSAKYNGLIIQPHQNFSFNTILGDVVASTGYVPEKVIKNGKIEYEYGGGICQVSTTLFRATINAGFPILERKPHAFPVHYYEPQGFDATIYPGQSDLRFTNDTAGPVLVQTHITGHNLFFEIYGIDDGRKVAIDGPYQYDQQPDGSLKAYFTRTINFASGASVSQRFNSVYKSLGLFPTEPNPYE